MKKLIRQLYVGQSCYIDFAKYMFATALIKRSSYWKSVVYYSRYDPFDCPPVADKHSVSYKTKKLFRKSEEPFNILYFSIVEAFI